MSRRKIDEAAHFEIITKMNQAPTSYRRSLAHHWLIRSGLALSVLTLSQCAQPTRMADPPIQCDACAEWNKPQPPFRIFGNTYYVGVEGLSAVLIDGGSELMLLDGGLSQSAPLVAKNIEALGFSLRKVRILAGSHAHHDHAGGLAALKRWSGAQAVASPRGAEALRTGNVTSDDPQAGFGPKEMAYPALSVDKTILDGESLSVGNVSVTGHYTPGHTPGGMSWSWQSCEGSRCLHMVYADSLNPISAPGFRFTQIPERVSAFRQSIATIRSLPCDVLISAHPGMSSLFERWEASKRTGSRDSFVQKSGCSDYAADAERKLDQRLAEEAR